MTLRAALIAAILAGTIGGVVLFSSDQSDSHGSSSSAGETPPARPPGAQLRGCRKRAQGFVKIRPSRKRDAILGPLALLGAPSSYRDYAARPDSELEPYPGIGMPAMKALAWLSAGTRVTLVVPKEQRRWMRLGYGRPHRRAWHAITLEACRTLGSRRARRRECGWKPHGACRWGQTTFSGGIGLDFASAPKRGRCAELIVWLEGRREPVRERLFRPGRGDCDEAETAHPADDDSR